MPNYLTHVHGPCTLALRKGPAGNFEQVGLSTDGFSIDFTVHDEPIMTDAAGRRVPADLQEMGMDATIRGRLVVYDDDLLSKYCLKLTDAVNEGEMPTIGLPIGQSGNQGGPDRQVRRAAGADHPRPDRHRPHGVRRAGVQRGRSRKSDRAG